MRTFCCLYYKALGQASARPLNQSRSGLLTTTLYEGLLFVVAPAFLQNLSKGRCGYPTKREFTRPIFCPHRPFFFDIHGGSWRSTSWGTCDYEASEPPFSSIWPVRSWLPFGKIHFNPTFFIPHRPFLNPHRQRAALSAVRRRPTRRTATRGARAVAAGGELPRGQHRSATGAGRTE